MREEDLPEQCPKCGGSRLAHVLWGYSTFTGEEAEAVGTSRALLGLNRRYFKTLEPGDPAPALLLEKTWLPKWACLDCNPRWLDLHHLTLKQCEAEAAKFAAFDAGDFEQAAALLHRQEEIERGQASEILVLLRELVGEAVTSRPGESVPQAPPPIQ
jgi:hypothetical protein